MKDKTNTRSNKHLEIFDPIAPGKLKKVQLSPRSKVLSGKRLGLFWNRKPNGDVLLSRFSEILKAYYQDITIEWLQGKGDPAQKAPYSALKEAQEKCDGVILASGD